MTTLPSKPPVPWSPLQSPFPSAAPQYQHTATITNIPVPIPPQSVISMSLADVIGILGFLLSLTTALVLWRKNRVKADVSDVVVTTVYVNKVGPFLEFTVVNKSALPVSIHAVDLEMNGFLYKHRVSNYSSFTSRFYREEVREPSAIRIRPGIQINLARFRPILLDAYQSTRIYTELLFQNKDHSIPHPLANNVQEPPDESHIGKYITLHLYTSRKKLRIDAQANLVDYEKWMIERTKILESEVILP